MGYEALTKRVEETATPEADISAIVAGVIGKIKIAIASHRGGKGEVHVDIPQLAKSEAIYEKPVVGMLAAEQEQIVGEIVEAVKATSMPGFHAMSIMQDGTVSITFN